MPQLLLTLDKKTGEGRLWRAPDGSLKTISGYDSVVTISLFTDAPAPVDTKLRMEERRGYLFDPIEDEEETTPIGSLLWLRQREVLTPELLKLCETDAKNALEWLVACGAVSEVNVSFTRLADQEDTARMVVELIGPSGDSVYSKEWELLFAV